MFGLKLKYWRKILVSLCRCVFAYIVLKFCILSAFNTYCLLIERVLAKGLQRQKGFKIYITNCVKKRSKRAKWWS